MIWKAALYYSAAAIVGATLAMFKAHSVLAPGVWVFIYVISAAWVARAFNRWMKLKGEP